MHAGAPLEATLAEARRCAEQGRIGEADLLYARVLDAAPAQAEALSHLGLRALASGRVDDALDRLTRARDAQPLDATAQRNLGLAQRAAGRGEEALASFREAVRLDPDFFIARLQAGLQLEALGRHRDALAAYYGAVTTAQRQGRWLSEATTAPALLPPVRHAMEVIDGGRAALFDASIAPLRERHGRDALARVEKALAIYLGDLPAAYADPRQKPSFLYVPDLPTTAWFERSLFPWYALFEDRYDAIRAELDAVIDDATAFQSFLKVMPGKSTADALTGTRGEPRWDAYFFYRHGERFEDNCQRCPVTAAALDAAPIVRLAGHAPECLYSKLTAGSHIRPHRGVTNTRVVTHFPLVVSGDGALRVGGEDREWVQGRCFTFDDTFLHEAWNHSERTRVVILMDSWNPYLSEAEVEACRSLVVAIADFNAEARLADPLVDPAHAQ